MGKDKIYFKAILLLSTIIMTSFMFIPEEKKTRRKKETGDKYAIPLFYSSKIYFILMCPTLPETH